MAENNENHNHKIPYLKKKMHISVWQSVVGIYVLSLGIIVSQIAKRKTHMKENKSEIKKKGKQRGKYCFLVV